MLVYKRLEAGRFQWPRTVSEAREITPEQFTGLMQGLAVEQKKDTAGCTKKNMLIGMMTGFVQNIEIFLPVSGGAFPCPGRKKGVHKRSVLLIKTVLHIFSMKTGKNNSITVKSLFG